MSKKYGLIILLVSTFTASPSKPYGFDWALSWEQTPICFSNDSFNTTVARPYCSLIRPSCNSPAYWQELAHHIGSRRIEKNFNNFLRTYVPCLFELKKQFQEGLLWQEIVALGEQDPFVKTMLDGDINAMDFFLSGPIDLAYQIEIFDMKVKADYLTIAFIIAFVDANSPDRYAVFRRLLVEGAKPSSALVLGQKSLASCLSRYLAQ